MISQQTLARAPQLQQNFNQATPFRHVVIENFFTDDVMAALHAQFPSFQNKNALNEFGRVGGKAVVTELDTIGPAYRDMYVYLNSRPFLDVVSAITGIPDLLPDPALYGGGTHENVEGQELDAHVDYNYINEGRLHRRLNLLVYFNKEWDAAWGGNIELHSNPRAPEDNDVKSYEPLYNRALIFETNEYSWHGFKKIVFPEDKKHLTRRSLAIYLYTRTRPDDEVAPPHGTFYVQRPLPEWFQPGHVVTEESRREIQILLARRDHWIEAYQKNELASSARIQELNSLLSEAGQITPRQIPRLIYRNLPLSGAGKLRLKSFVFSNFGFMFKNRKAYRNWLAQRENN